LWLFADVYIEASARRILAGLRASSWQSLARLIETSRLLRITPEVFKTTSHVIDVQRSDDCHKSTIMVA
jgi:hypothetical protein